MRTRNAPPNSRASRLGCLVPVVGVVLLLLVLAWGALRGHESEWFQRVAGPVVFLVLLLMLAFPLLTLPFLLSGLPDGNDEGEPPARPGPSAPAIVSARTTVRELEQARWQLAKARRMLDQLEAERDAVRREKRDETDRYERLASITREQAELVEHLITRQLVRQSRTTWVQWYVSLLLAFLLGLVVNWVSDPVYAWLLHLGR
ncbi:hypothetical protein ACI2K4_33235 [Micromonospora sp. NPDC050397]|uniref:hypothetical protein n=1 Tax=Micromonospora sp. NPDC050397 TaxID=3364279 RepID=UPI00384D6549